jgi:hypothetical protein
MSGRENLEEIELACGEGLFAAIARINEHAFLKVEIERPRLRSFEGREQALPSWEAAISEDWLVQVGHEPDADQRLDAQSCPFGSAA